MSRQVIREAKSEVVRRDRHGKERGVIATAALCAILMCCGCRRDMFHQPSGRPLAKSDFFPDQMASRQPITNTVARGQLEDDAEFYTGLRGTNPVTSFPFPITMQVLQRGKEQFEIYCSVCHGRTGMGNGMIVQRGFPAPPSYHIDRLRDAPPGHFVDVMKHGYGIMYSYGDRVDATNRWAVAAYIQALQLSQHAALAQLPANERNTLEAAK